MHNLMSEHNSVCGYIFIR